MKAFEECLEGHFTNKYQAMKHPTRYSHINISHVRIDDNLFYGEQAYNYAPSNPYRQFILKVIPQGGDVYVIENYYVHDFKQYVNFNNIQNLRNEGLLRRNGCDTIFTLDGDTYKGHLPGKECIVPWRGRDTYLQNEIELGEDFYWVMDRGFDVNTNHQVWGSQWGVLKFYRRHDII